MRQGIAAIVFDFDNTLVPFFEMKRECVDAALNAMLQYGLPGPKNVLQRIVHEIYRNETMEDPNLFTNVAEYRGVRDPQKIALLAEAGRYAYRERQRRVMKPYDRIPETLDTLKMMNLKLAILSDAPARKVYNRLFETDLANFFIDHVVGYDHVGKLKPSPEGFQSTLKLVGCPDNPERVIYVGDNLVRDGLGAKRMGMKTAWAAYGAHPAPGDKTLQKEIDYVLKTPSDIVDFLNP
jgi:putative hydrolase of the HAD superfamily